MDAKLVAKWVAAAGCTLGGLHFWSAAPSVALAPRGSTRADARAGRPAPLAHDATATTMEGTDRSDSPEPRPPDAPDPAAPADAPSPTSRAPAPRADPRPNSARVDAALLELPPLPPELDGEPRIPEPLARAAMRYVGLDPAAEAIWALAINDLRLAPDTREDLIQDIDEETLPDPRHVTEADVPLILARLAILERLAPRATDATNVTSFGEAYKDLLEVLVQVRGEGARGR